MPAHPLHEFDDTHLWEESFGMLAATHISPGDDVLLVAPDGRTATTIKDDLRDALDVFPENFTVYTDDQADPPFDPDSFDVTLHDNPSRGILQRHSPLYAMTAITRKEGTIVYRAPNYVAESDAVTLETLYCADWEPGSGDSALAAVFTVTADGDTRTTAGDSPDDAAATGSHSLTDFGGETA